MSVSKKLAMVMLVTGVLAGCNEKPTYDYLLQHPDVLKREIEKCESPSMNPSSERLIRCEMVSRAATTLMSFITAQQEDPQAFGQQILDLEMACAKSKQMLTDAQQKVDELKAKNASAQELQTANEQAMKAQQIYEKQHNEVKTMLAVVGINSPE